MKNAGGNAPPRQKLGRAQSRFVFCCLAPVMVLFVVFLLAPIAISVVLSFFNYSPLSDKAVFVGLQYYSYTVSYTHLDVYKRQAPGARAGCCAGSWRLPGTGECIFFPPGSSVPAWRCSR